MCGYSVVPASLVVKTVLPVNYLDTLVNNELTINVRVYFWTLSYIPLIYKSVLKLVSTLL